MFTDPQGGGMDMQLLEALLANMQSMPQGQFGGGGEQEVDDDDDDDYEDEDDDDDDDEYEYSVQEHSIHTIPNPYGGEGEGELEQGEMGGNHVSLPTMQTMSILQGLLNMNPNAMQGGMAEMAAGMGMGGGDEGGMEQPVSAGNFMQSFMPNMNADMAGALAGAFAGGMGAFMDGYGGGGATVTSLPDDFDEGDEDDDALTDEEEDDDEEDDDEDDEEDMEDVRQTVRSHNLHGVGMGMAGVAGGMMASAGLMAGAAQSARMASLREASMMRDAYHHTPATRPHPGQYSSPKPTFLAASMQAMHLSTSMQLPPKQIASTPQMQSMSPQMLPMSPQIQSMSPHIQSMSPHLQSMPHHMQHMSPHMFMSQQMLSHRPMSPPTCTGLIGGMPLNFPPNMTAQSPQQAGFSPSKPQLSAVAKPQLSVSVSMPMLASVPPNKQATSMSGGNVSLVDPLASLPQTGMRNMSPVMANQSFSKHNVSDASNSTLISDESLNLSSKTITANSDMALAEAAVALSQLHLAQSMVGLQRPQHPNELHMAQLMGSLHGYPCHPDSVLKGTPKNGWMMPNKDDMDDDKASVSTESGYGKSDTESLRKRSPTHLHGKQGRLSPTSSESTPATESNSCASITDLASATDSMRDSDTDNHSDAHNVTANLSDADSDLQEPHHNMRGPQYAVGSKPIVIEKPTFSWNSMIGLDRPKEALRSLFLGEAFPEVFEGTRGSCKGILLFGPSGSGKTCLARSLAHEIKNAIFIGMSTPFLATQEPMEAPSLVRRVFDYARQKRPAVILLDEVEALCYEHIQNSETIVRLKAEILAQIRGQTTLHPIYKPQNSPLTFNDGLMVIGSTNQPWLLQDDVRRIFTYNIHVKLPDDRAREELMRVFLQNLPHNVSDEQYRGLVELSDGYSAADISTVITHVAYMPPNQYLHHMARIINYEDLGAVMTQYRCRFTKELAYKYQSYIQCATHRSADDGKGDRKEAKGVRRFGQRIAKSLAAAFVAVID